MKMSSAEAAKLLRRLAEEREMLLDEERESCEFVAAIQEDTEAARPAYDFAATQAALDAIDEKTRRVKHAINVFNTTHALPDIGMTIDEALVAMPQLTRKKEKLGDMARRLEKQRVDNAGSPNIEYNYANYDVRAARERYKAVSELLARLQTALDVENTKRLIEVNLEDV